VFARLLNPREWFVVDVREQKAAAARWWKPHREAAPGNKGRLI
jgi:hypothetical protein